MKKPKGYTSRKQLRNGCSRGSVFISPKNYKSLKHKSDLEKDWFVECRFFDPEHPEYANGYQFRRRPPKEETLFAQKQIIELYVKIMEDELDLKNLNPIDRVYMSDRSNDLNPYMDFKSAVEKARLKLSGSSKHLNEVKIAINRFLKSADALHYSYFNIREIKIWHIKNTLDHCGLTPNYYNKFRQYLKDIFKELIERGCIDHNPVRDISKKKTNPKIREIISDDKIVFIDKYLKENHYNFFRYKEIFYHSGSRSTELFRVQKKHVNLESQEYTMQIQKGNSYKWVTKAINVGALEYWKEVISLCESDDDFLFSKNLIPGPMQISSRQITIRWNKYVKNTENIKNDNGSIIRVTEDFYSWKYLYLDKLDAIQNSSRVIPIDFNIAQAAGSHTSDRTTSIYTVGRNKRQIEFLKTVKVG